MPTSKASRTNAFNAKTQPLLVCALAVGLLAVFTADTADAKGRNLNQLLKDYSGITSFNNAVKPIGKFANNKVRKPLRNFGKSLQKIGIGD